MKMVEKSYRSNGNNVYSVIHNKSTLEMFALVIGVRGSEITVRVSMHMASDNRIPKVVRQFVSDNFNMTEDSPCYVSFVSYDSMAEVMKKLVEMSIRVEDVFTVYLDELNYRRNIEKERELKEKQITDNSVKMLKDIVSIINSLSN